MFGHLFLLADLGVAEVLKYMSQIGVLGLLTLILFGGYKKWWVFGWIYRDAEERCAKVEKERNDWRDLALRGTGLVEQTVNLFKQSGSE